MFDVVVVGGGPSGATAAEDLARSGHSVALLDRDGRIKPCGGAIPPRLMEDFAITDDQLVANVRAAMRENPGLKVYFARGDFKGLSGFYTSGVIEGGYHYGVFSDP